MTQDYTLNYFPHNNSNNNPRSPLLDCIKQKVKKGIEIFVFSGETHVFRGDDLLELRQGELLLVLGQVVAEDLLKVLQVLRRKTGAVPAIKKSKMLLFLYAKRMCASQISDCRIWEGAFLPCSTHHRFLVFGLD